MIKKLASRLITDPGKRSLFLNWWDYHKWYAALAVFLLGFLFVRIGSAFGWFEKKPDLQIAYIGSRPLPDDTAAAAETAFSLLAGDYNHDGKAIVTLHQYTFASSDSQDDAFYASYASEIEIIGDITDCDSYLFLMEDPQDVQQRFQILANPDGSVPAASDYSVKDKCFQWEDCSLLSSLELGNYEYSFMGETMTGKNQDLLSGLFLGRRCFESEKTSSCLEECAALWVSLTT